MMKFKPWLLARYWLGNLRKNSERRAKRNETLKKLDRSSPHLVSSGLERDLVNFANAGSVRCVSVLVEDCRKKNVSLDVYMDNGKTPLLLAIAHGSVETVIVLLEGGADPHGFSDFGDFIPPNFDQGSKDPLFRAVQRGLSAKGVNAIARRYTKIEGLREAFRMLMAEPGPYEHDLEQGIAVRELLLSRIYLVERQGEHSNTVVEMMARPTHHAG